jgi:hypothetical protein
MHLLFLHGAPASGKYTVGRELARLTGFEFFHNHLVVDAVLARHAFGTPEFVAERDRLWREHLGAAPTRVIKGLIFTFNPESTVPPDFITWLFTELPARHGVRMHSIEVFAEEAAIETRLGSEDRQAFRKLTDLALYRQLRDSGAFSQPTIPRTDLRVETTDSAPTAIAGDICTALGLGGPASLG